VADKEKGNTTTLDLTGYVDDAGDYTLYYAQGKKGAPVGWYRVQVTAAPPGNNPLQMPRPGGEGPPPIEPVFDRKFTRADSSGLEIEVVKNPSAGAYDLKLTK
jgi:hypothetical protein